jgi:MFS family permease
VHNILYDGRLTKILRIMTALLELGAFIGSIIAGYFADRYSRKGSIWFGMVWFIVGR